MKACKAGKIKPLKGDSCDATAIKIANRKAKGKKESLKLTGEHAFINYTDVMEAEATLVEEDGEGKKMATIRVIKAGWSKNKRYYPEEVIEQIAKLMIKATSRKLYVDHPREWADLMGRSMKDWAATAKETWVEDSAAFAKVKMINNENVWIWDVMKESPSDVGVSINGIGDVEEDWEDENGRKGLLVKKMEYLISSDFVTVPGAGGRALEVSTESLDPSLIEDIDLKYLPFVRAEEQYDELDSVLEDLEAEEALAASSNENPDTQHNEEGLMDPLTPEVLRGITYDQLATAGNPSVAEAVKKASDEAVKDAVEKETQALKEQLESSEKEAKELTSELAKTKESLEKSDKEKDELLGEKLSAEADAFVAEITKDFAEGIITEERIKRWTETAKTDQESVKNDAEEIKKIIEDSKDTEEESSGTETADEISAKKSVREALESGLKSGGNGQSELKVDQLVRDLKSN